MALLFALPAWILWDGRTGSAFVGFVLATATVPDLDLVLHGLGLPVKHHGVMHTVVFVLGVAVLAGAVAVAVLKPTLKRWWRLTEDETADERTITLFVTGGFALGGLSHLFADMLAGDGYEPIEPLWPVVQSEIEFTVAHYTSPWLNGILFAVAVALHLGVLLSGTFPIETRVRGWLRDQADGGSPEPTD
jgi:hypothetical protein